MRKLPWICIVCAMIIIPLIYGIYVRNTHFKEDINLNNLNEYIGYDVGWIYDQQKADDNDLKNMANIMEHADVIAKVKCTGGSSIVFSAIRQDVTVEKIYKGKEYLQTGEKIVLLDNYVALLTQDKLISGTLVNLMKKNDEYLVFVDSTEKKTGKSSNVFTYILNANWYFNYQNKDNYVPEKQVMSIPYNLVKNNEFFAMNKLSLDAMENLKTYFMDKYSAD